MKKVLVFLLAFIMILSMSSCSVKEKVTEKVIEEAIGEEVDIDGDTIKVTGDDGTEVTIGSSEWPSSEIIKQIPEFKDGTIVSVLDSGTYVMIVLEDVDKADYEKYEDVIRNDFTNESAEFSMDGVTSYLGMNSDNVYGQVSYNETDNTMTIIVSKDE